MIDAAFAMPALLGRERELARLDALLDAGDSVFVVVSGPAGIGKTRLLAEFAARAERREWAAGRSVEVGPGTSREAILETLPHTATAGEGAIAPASPDAGRGAAVPVSGDARRGAGSIVDTVKRPALLRFDGFEPEPVLAKWLLDQFLPELMKRPGVIVAIAERETDHEPLSVLPAERMALEPPRAAVRTRLERVGAQLAPPADESEIASLTDALAAEPALIEPLIRALRFAREDA